MAGRAKATVELRRQLETAQGSAICRQPLLVFFSSQSIDGPHTHLARPATNGTNSTLAEDLAARILLAVGLQQQCSKGEEKVG